MRPLAAIACLALTACGGESTPPDPGDQPNSLDIASEGDSVGLPLDGVAVLAVSYLTHDGRPIEGASIGFELVAAASETTAGSTLSASASPTDRTGRAEVTVSAGGARANFRVRASAPGAAPLLFYVSVSDDGFTRLSLAPVHHGFRALEVLVAVELRLYRTAELGCAGFDFGAPSESVMPPRTLAGFGPVAELGAVPAADGLTVAGWAVAEAQGLPLAVGCVELPATALPAGQAVRVEPPIEDLTPALPGALALTSRLDMTPLAAALTVASDPWRQLACPLGPAQLAIDCALDAAAPDGALDCTPGGGGALAAAIAARRAPMIADCRPAQLAGGAPSVDAALMEAFGPPFSAAELDALLAARRAPLEEVALASVLDGDGGAVRHRLESAAIGGADPFDLVASLRPVVEAGAPATVDGGGQLDLAEHGFTFDYGDVAARGFADLAPDGAPVRALGDALYRSVADDGGVGCPALSRVVCGEVGQPADCLTAPCLTARGALDDRLAAWLDALAVDGIDLTLAGNAAIADDDLDLVIDGLAGEWSATLSVTAGDVALTGELVAP